MTTYDLSKRTSIGPLSESILQAIDNNKTFTEWINSLNPEFIAGYKDKIKKKDQKTERDVVLTGMLWIEKFRTNIDSGFNDNEIYFIANIISLLLTQLYFINRHKKDNEPEALKLRPANNQTWHPNEIFVDVYFDADTLTYSNEPVGTSCLTALVLRLEEDRKSDIIKEF